MKKMKKRLKRVLVLALTIAVTGSGLPLAALNVSASDVAVEQDLTTETMPEDILNDNVQSEEAVPEEIETGEESLSETESHDVESTENTNNIEISEDNTTEETTKESSITTVECDLSDYIVQEGGLETIEDATVGRNAATADVEGAKAALLEGLLNREAEIDISSYKISTDQIEALIAEVINENSELFYVGSQSYSFDEETDLVISCIFDYKYDATTTETYNAALEAAYKEAIPDATGMSDVQKARALHDYLCQHVQYDSSTSYKYTAYGAIVNGLAVCQGYTLAYQALLNKAGISNGLCPSDAMKHIWNYVKIGSYWYHVDVTWDDPTYDRDGYVRHYYFLNSDTKIKTAAPNSTSTHSSWNSNSYTCSSTTYDNQWWASVEYAIFYIDGYEYYLKTTNAGTTSQAIALIRRSGSTETQMCSATTGKWTNYGNTSVLYKTAFSSLSYYDGTLYFNDKTKIYSVYPGQKSKTTVYTYTGSAGYICGSLVCGNKIKICVKKKPYGSEETNLTETKPNNPYSSVKITANPTSLTYG